MFSLWFLLFLPKEYPEVVKKANDPNSLPDSKAIPASIPSIVVIPLNDPSYLKRVVSSIEVIKRDWGFILVSAY